MKLKSIFARFLIPTILIMVILALSILTVTRSLFVRSYEGQIISQNNDKNKLIAQSVENFMDKAYQITQELAMSTEVMSMQTDIQTPLLQEAAERNDYFELLYVQDMKGDQTARSTGKLGNRANRWWFQEMLELREPFISKSYYSVSTNMACASIFIPVEKDEEMIGIFASDIKLSFMTSIIEENSDLENGEITFILDGEGVVVAHPESVYYEELYNYKNMTRTITKKDKNGETVLDEQGNIVTEECPIEVSEEYADIINKVMSGENGSVQIHDNGKTYYASYMPVKLNGKSDTWSVVTLQQKDLAMGIIGKIEKIGSIVTIVNIAIAVILISLITRSITKPIGTCVEGVKRLSDGDLSTKLPYANGNHEVAQLQNRLAKTLDELNDMIQQITGFVKAVEKGDYTKELTHNFDGDFNVLVDSLSAVTISTRNTLIQIHKQCVGLIGAIHTMDERARDLSDGTTSQASAIEQLSATLAEVSEKVSINAKHSRESSNKIDSVRDIAADGKENLNKLSNAMSVIAENSKEINHISKMIQNIASQTNLLSMNASVEAARAGEAGKGFAVVADEIRQLAAKCTQAATSAEELVDKTYENIKEGMKALEVTEHSIEAVAEESKDASTYLRDISALSEEQAEAVVQISNAVDQISEVVQNNSANAAESAEITREMKNQVSSLGALLRKYKY